MSQAPKRASNRLKESWKLIPGLAISAFFLWRTVRSIRVNDLRSMQLQHPAWLLGLLAFFLADYALRSYRWWYMLRRFHARYIACARVLLTSLAANNILPFRVGDFMRIFAYAPDVNAPSSTVLSTVLLERLLDTVMLFAFLVIGLTGADSNFPPIAVRGHSFGVLKAAGSILILVAFGLGLLLFGTRLLYRVTQRLVARFGEGPRGKKIAEWATLLFDAILDLSFVGRLWLLVLTAGVWACECMVFVSCAKMIGISSGPRGPWLAGALSNLSFLLPSAPGGIGPFEASAKVAMQSQGALASDAALYALLVHVIIFFAICALGGAGMILHRVRRSGVALMMDEASDPIAVAAAAEAQD